MRDFANPLTDYSPMLEQFEFVQEFTTGRRDVFSEQQEMELASELLEIENEQELEQFLGDLISKAGKAIGGFIKSPVGQAIGGVLNARQFVKFAGDTVKNALQAPPSIDPNVIARAAAAEAAGDHVPGLADRVLRSGDSRQGTWKRHGHKIVLFGI